MKRQSLLVDEESKLIQYIQTMATNQEMKIINIPKIAFRFFIHIADGNLDNGSLAQTMCYFLGPKQKTGQDEIWIDTILIPNQTCTSTSVEDNGIGPNDTFAYLRKHCMTKNVLHLDDFHFIQGI